MEKSVFLQKRISHSHCCLIGIVTSQVEIVEHYNFCFQQEGGHTVNYLYVMYFL